MKLIYLGTPHIAVPTLTALHSKHEIVCVVTQPDKSSGRSGTLEPSPVAVEAARLGLNCIKPEKLTQEVTDYLKGLQSSYFITFAYGKIFKEDFLHIAENGGLNIHPSLLPEYRGASPMQSALADGKTSSGITIQKIVLSVDSGDIILSEPFTILSDDDIVSVEEKVSHLSADMILRALDSIHILSENAVKQDDSKATWCRKFEKQDGIISWLDNANSISWKIRAFTRWPVASTLLDGKKLNIVSGEPLDDNGYEESTPGTVVTADRQSGIRVKCGTGVLKINSLQLQGKKILSANDFLNGYKNFRGKILGQE